MLSLIESINKGVQFIVDYISNGLKYRNYAPNIWDEFKQYFNDIAVVLPYGFFSVLVLGVGVSMLKKFVRW